MKRGYFKLLYNQRNKDETIMSVIKRLFGEHLMSRLIRTQNRELSFRCITYNMHRLTNLVILIMFSTKPYIHKNINSMLRIFDYSKFRLAVNSRDILFMGKDLVAISFRVRAS